MTGQLAEACGDLRRVLPEAGARIAYPDSDGTRTRHQPGSSPPWNGAVAAALFDALEGIRQLAVAYRLQVAGRHTPRRPMSATGATLTEIISLSYAVAPGERDQAVIMLNRWTTAILQLPAIDEQERPQRVASPCPYCGFGMLRVFPRSGRVTCLRYGACFDGDGNHPVGMVEVGRVSAEPLLVWRDGKIQVSSEPQTRAEITR